VPPLFHQRSSRLSHPWTSPPPKIYPRGESSSPAKRIVGVCVSRGPPSRHRRRVESFPVAATYVGSGTVSAPRSRLPVWQEVFKVDLVLTKIRPTRATSLTQKTEISMLTKRGICKCFTPILDLDSEFPITWRKRPDFPLKKIWGPELSRNFPIKQETFNKAWISSFLRRHPPTVDFS
jgi:hypothetical protein